MLNLKFIVERTVNVMEEFNLVAFTIKLTLFYSSAGDIITVKGGNKLQP